MDYIKAHQSSSGGFGYAAGTGSDSNDTAAALMALRAAGTPCSWRVMDRGYAYMHSLQRSDHGYALTSSAGSDSQSTGWAIAARIKCHMSNTARARLPGRPQALERDRTPTARASCRRRPG